MTKEITSEKYEGLIARAAELVVTHEDSGWKLAEFVADAVKELFELGLNVVSKDPQRITAAWRVARDLGVSQNQVLALRATWTKYGIPSERMTGLTFSDHRLAASRPTRVQEIKKRRAQIKAAGSFAQRAVSRPPVDPLAPYQRFTAAKSQLRKTLDSNVWDYPDREKALAYAQEIHQLAVEVLTKFGGQQQSPAPRSRRKAAA